MKRAAVITDIHGNLPALQASLAAIDAIGIDQIFCGGDLVGYGPHPNPLTIASEADDHKRYYPGSHPIAMRYTGDRRTGQLLGLQLVGHLGSEIAKRVDTVATAIFNDLTVDAIGDLDLSYTPPLGSPWDALQAGAQAWTRQTSMQAGADANAGSAAPPVVF